MVAGQSDVGHRHESVWELMVQAEGTGMEHACGKQFEIRPGDVMLYPAGSRHGTHNRSRGSMYQYVIHFELTDVPQVEKNPRLRLMPGRPLCSLGRDGMLWFEQLFNQLWWEDTVRQEGVERVEDALLKLLFVGLERRLSRDTANLAHMPRPDVMRFVNHVRESIAERSPLHVAAERMGTSYDSLRHRFKEEIGMSPKRFLTGLRTQQAKHLLLTTRLSIKEIAERLGYADAHHFSAGFARQTGQAPRYWRQRPDLRS